MVRKASNFTNYTAKIRNNKVRRKLYFVNNKSNELKCHGHYRNFFLFPLSTSRPRLGNGFTSSAPGSDSPSLGSPQESIVIRQLQYQTVLVSVICEFQPRAAAPVVLMGGYPTRPGCLDSKSPVKGNGSPSSWS